MKRHIAIAIFLISFVPVVHGQSAADLAQRFPHHEVYEVEPGVVMSAKFASNGLVCEMQVQKAHFNKDFADPSDGIDLDKMDTLVDRLVPASERGDKDQVLGSSLFHQQGTVMVKIDQYANITVQVFWNVKEHKKSVQQSNGSAVLVIKWRHRSCS